MDNVNNVRGLSFAFGYHWGSEQMAERQVEYDHDGEDKLTRGVPNMKDIGFNPCAVNLTKILSYIPIISLVFVLAIHANRNNYILAHDNFTWYAKALLYTRVAICAIGAGAIFLPIDLIATVIKGIRHHCWDLKKSVSEMP